MGRRWPHLRDAAAEAVVWGSIETVAKEHKETARSYLVEQLTAEGSRGVDAVAADGTIIGTVTRSKPAEKVQVVDEAAFVQWVYDHRPDMLTVDWRAKDALLRTLRMVDGVAITPGGDVVEGVAVGMSSGTVRVTPDPHTKDVVRELLADGIERGYGIKAIEEGAMTVREETC